MFIWRLFIPTGGCGWDAGGGGLITMLIVSCSASSSTNSSRGDQGFFCQKFGWRDFWGRVSRLEWKITSCRWRCRERVWTAGCGRRRVQRQCLPHQPDQRCSHPLRDNHLPVEYTSERRPPLPKEREKKKETNYQFSSMLAWQYLLNSFEVNWSLETGMKGEATGVFSKLYKTDYCN